MTFVLSGGEEGYSKDLDIFSVPDIETGILERYEKEYKPVTSYSSSDAIVFQVNNASADYIDVKTMSVAVSYKIYTDKGVGWDDGKNLKEFCGPVNLPVGCFFSQCDFEINQINLNSGVGKNYAYKAYIDTMLSAGLDAENSYLTTAGFYKDAAGSMDDSKGTQNLNLRKRADLTIGGKIAKLTGRVYSDFSSQPKALINGVALTLRFKNADDKFRLMWTDATDLYDLQADDMNENQFREGVGPLVETARIPEYYKLKLVDVALTVGFIKVHPALLMDHSKMLSAEKPAVYPFTRTEIKVFSISASLADLTVQNPFNDKIPKKLIIGLLDSLAYGGSNKKNPFNFQHFDLTDISFEINNKMVNKPMRLDFPNKHFNDGFVSIFKTCMKKNGIPPNIGIDDYYRGYAFFCFDLENTKEEGILSPMEKGNSRLSLKFKNNLTDSISVLAMGSFDSVLYIDQARNAVLREG